MAGDKLSADTHGQTRSRPATSSGTKRAGPMPARAQAAPSLVALGSLTGSRPLGNAERAARMSAAHATVGTARLNRILGPSGADPRLSAHEGAHVDQHRNAGGAVGSEASRATPEGTGQVIRRACSCGRACCGAHEEDKVARRAGDGAVDSVPARVVNAVAPSTGGRPLDASVRGQMESAFGRDFGNVRVHGDTNAADAADALQARAFTVGDHMFFGAGRWAPETADGRELLGHELAHVAQQGDRGGALSTARADELTIGSPADPLEAHAREAGRSVRRGDRVPSSSISVSSASPAVRGDFLSDAWDTAVSTGQEIKQGVTSAVGAVVDTVESTGEAVAQGVTNVVGSVEQSVTTAVGAVGQGVASAAKAAGSWLEDEAVKLALAAAQALARRLGGSIELVGTELHIGIPEIELLAEERDTEETPRVVRPYPLLVDGAAFGPVVIAGGVFSEVAEEGRAEFILGPIAIRNILLTIDLVSGASSANGQLHVPATVDVSEAEEEGIDVAVAVYIQAGEVPILLEADLFGGIRTTTQGSGEGSVSETVSLRYSGGKLTLDAVDKLSLGARLDKRWDWVGELNVEDMTILEFTSPIAAVNLGEIAGEFTLPFKLGYSSDSGPTFDSGPIGIKEIPMGDIEAPQPRWVMTPLSAIIDKLCHKGKEILPPGVCAAAPQVPGALPQAPPGPTPHPPCSPTGLTDSDPIAMVWYKPASMYPEQITIHGHAYRRDDPTRLPHGEPIGVPNRYWPSTRKKPFQLIPEERGSGADDFRTVLRRYGYDLTALGLQADHVQDLQWEGPDAFRNLWPLDMRQNMSAGNRQNNLQAVSFCVAAHGPLVTRTIAEVKQMPGGYGRWFRIARIEY